MIVPLGAAIRDPKVFCNPDRFDVTRGDTAHVAFAHGMHFCVGATLARTEMKIVLPRVFTRFPKMQLAEEQITWQPTLDFRGPNQLLARS